MTLTLERCEGCAHLATTIGAEGARYCSDCWERIGCALAWLDEKDVRRSSLEAAGSEAGLFRALTRDRSREAVRTRRRVLRSVLGAVPMATMADVARWLDFDHETVRAAVREA